MPLDFLSLAWPLTSDLQNRLWAPHFHIHFTAYFRVLDAAKLPEMNRTTSVILLPSPKPSDSRELPRPYSISLKSCDSLGQPPNRPSPGGIGSHQINDCHREPRTRPDSPPTSLLQPPSACHQNHSWFAFPGSPVALFCSVTMSTLLLPLSSNLAPAVANQMFFPSDFPQLFSVDSSYHTITKPSILAKNPSLRGLDSSP